MTTSIARVGVVGPFRGLSTAEIRALVEATSGAEGRPRRLADELAAETAGNPLFVGAVLAGLRGGDSDETLPPDVRVRGSAARAAAESPTRDMLQVAAVVGLEFGLEPWSMPRR